MSAVSIIGCGFVADLYMASLATFPDLRVVSVWDHDSTRLQAFCAHYGLNAAASMEDLLARHPATGVVVNLTNPHSHYDVNKACLIAGAHVYSEKPLATDMQQATELHAIAAQQSLILASAPCSVLGEAAQTMGHALRNGTAGTPRLIYAELDDGFIPQAPYRDWRSTTGAPWPAEDEFNVGCTLEHAGYYLGWLIAWFGSVRKLVAASAEVLPDKPGSTDLSGQPGTPDFSTAVLFFEDGPVTRLTCSIAAPHDQRIRVIGDDGVLQLKQAWNNAAPVKYHRRLRIRRRLLEHPLGRRIKLAQPTHPKVGRWGAAAMNFALGPVEVLTAIAENRLCRLSNAYSLHLNEVTLAIQNADEDAGAQIMTTRCERMEPMPWAR